MSSPRTRGNKPKRSERYPPGEFPPNVITAIGKQIIYRLAVGNADISGDDFADIFADAIEGKHRKRPEGIVDVAWERNGWSVKTVKQNKPFVAKKVRLISGRNSPIYSYSHDVSDVINDPQMTGDAVLGIWNERVKQARYNSDDLRVVVLLRNMDSLEFSIFEQEINQFIAADYKWKKNKKNNLEGYDSASDEHCFTFQPHGSQFTIIRTVPASATHFTLQRPPVVPPNKIYDAIGYNDSWVKIVGDV